jgi:hypothetical protein
MMPRGIPSGKNEEKMTKRVIAVLSLRIIALLSVLTAIGPGARVLPAMLLNWPFDTENGSLPLLMASIAAPIVLPLLFGGALWFGAGRLASLLCHEDRITGDAPSYEMLQNLAFSIVGVFVLSSAIPSFAKLVYYYWQLSVPGGVQVGSDVEWKGAVIEVVTRLFIGIWLIFGTSGITNVLRKIQGK